MAEDGPEPTGTPGPGPVRGEMVRMLLVNAIAPYVVYVLCEPRVGNFAALALSAVPPMVEGVWSIVRQRRVDIVAALVLGGIAVSLVLIALGGSARMLLLRESLLTCVVGVVLAGSVAMRRPLLFYLSRQMAAAGDPAGHARWNERWEREPALRRSLRVLSLVWGVGLVVEMAVRTVMLLGMETSHFLLVSPFVQYGLTGALAAWTFLYMRRR